MKRWQFQHGFSLVEIMMALGIMGVVVGGGMRFFDVGVSHRTTQMGNAQISKWTFEIASILEQETSCRASWTEEAHLAVAGDTITDLHYAPAVPSKIYTGPRLATDESFGFRIDSMRIIGTPLTLGTVPSGLQKKLVTLEVNFAVNANAKQLREENAIVTKHFPFIAEVNGANAISNCYGFFNETAIINEICVTGFGGQYTAGSCRVPTAVTANFTAEMASMNTRGANLITMINSVMRDMSAIPLAPASGAYSSTLCCGSAYTTSNCTSAGGVVVDIGGGNNICRFSTAPVRCPTNWWPYRNWSTTTSNTCANETPCTGSVNSGNHGWSDAGVEKTPRFACINGANASVCGLDGDNDPIVCSYLSTTVIEPCEATITQIGCF